MKLLFCSSCGDVFAIHKQERSCLCGKTKGRYLDNVNAVYSGTGAVPLGFHNQDFINSVLRRPQEGMGKEFVAFVIPYVAPSFKEEKPALPDDLASEIAKKLSSRKKMESFSEFVKLKESREKVDIGNFFNRFKKEKKPMQQQQQPMQQR